MPSTPREIYRFGQFELEVDAAELRRRGRRLKVQPQPFKLLVLLVRRADSLVGRDDIRTELWPDGTFVDFDQSVNFAVRQIRDVLGDSADRPLYIETIPRRGYRFIAPLEEGTVPENATAPFPSGSGSISARLDKALWSNIAELKIAEERRRRLTLAAIVAGALVLAVLIACAVIVIRRAHENHALERGGAEQINTDLQDERSRGGSTGGRPSAGLSLMIC
jgi:DNA-binding winged helix-turn-helix (wHTH) protein